MIRYILQLGLLLILVSCGEENSAGYLVSAGPEESIKSHKSGGKVSATPESDRPSDDLAETEDSDPGSSSTISGNSTCLYDCMTDARAKLTFSAALSYELPGCEINSVRGMEQDSGIRLLVKANCDITQQLYTLELDLEGVPKGSLVLVSQICKDARAPVGSFDVGMGANKVLAVFACDYNPNSYYSKDYRLYARSMTSSGTLGEQVSIETTVIQYGTLTISLKYNDQAKAFGLSYLNRFQRLSEAGAKLGGVIATGYDNGFLLSANGSWVVLKTQQGGQCSRISSVGILECNQKTISSLDRQFTSGGRALSFAYDWDKTPVKSIAINPDNCTETLSTSVGSLQTSSARLTNLGSGTWLNGLSYALYFNASLNGLNMSLVDEPKSKILADISVANYKAISSAWTYQKNGYVLVFFVSEGDIFVTSGRFM